MKSPFKFLDSYTKDDREIFFGRNTKYPDFIPPLQGLEGIGVPFRFRRFPKHRIYILFNHNRIFLLFL
jgi:hypothetical protein